MTRTDGWLAAVAAGFPLGALGHAVYVVRNGLLFHGKAPEWAPLFWYALCVVDLVMPWLVWRRPRVGLLAAVAVMATTLSVNLLFFPKFEGGSNPVLLSLLAFGAFVFIAAPRLWRGTPWRRQPGAAVSAAR